MITLHFDIRELTFFCRRGRCRTWKTDRFCASISSYLFNLHERCVRWPCFNRQRGAIHTGRRVTFDQAESGRARPTLDITTRHVTAAQAMVTQTSNRNPIEKVSELFLLPRTGNTRGPGTYVRSPPALAYSYAARSRSGPGPRSARNTSGSGKTVPCCRYTS